MISNHEEAFVYRDQILSLADGAEQAAIEAERWALCADNIADRTAAMAAMESSRHAGKAQIYAKVAADLAKTVADFVTAHGGEDYRTHEYAAQHARQAALMAERATQAADRVMHHYGPSLRKHKPAEKPET